MSCSISLPIAYQLVGCGAILSSNLINGSTGFGLGCFIFLVVVFCFFFFCFRKKLLWIHNKYKTLTVFTDVHCGRDPVPHLPFQGPSGTQRLL